jgi:hypothetical protein
VLQFTCTEKPDSRNRSVRAIPAVENAAGAVERGFPIDPGIADRLRAMGYLR